MISFLFYFFLGGGGGGGAGLSASSPSTLSLYVSGKGEKKQLTCYVFAALLWFCVLVYSVMNGDVC